jgi:hypothetical protein
MQVPAPVPLVGPNRVPPGPLPCIATVSNKEALDGLGDEIESRHILWIGQQHIKSIPFKAHGESVWIAIFAFAGFIIIHS